MTVSTLRSPLMKEYLSKTMPVFYARIRQPYPKRSGCTDLMIGSTKAHSIMPRTSAFIGINVAKTNACGKILICGVKCSSCPTCNQTCPDFERERYNRLDKAPYVCNRCPNVITRCTIAHKYRYDAIFANRKYKDCLKSSREGMSLTKHELHEKDMVITTLIYQGQSPYQIIANHPELDMSVRTLYSYLEDGTLTARNIDLKRKVKFKPRKVHKSQIKERAIFEGRL